MSKKRKFGLDIDGTVTSPHTFIPYINDAFNKNLTLDDITQYNLSIALGISEKKFWQWMDQNEPKIYEQAPLFSPSTKSILKKWEKHHELFYISARREHLLDTTYSWFKKHNIPYSKIECVGERNKVEFVKDYQLDIFFEDKHENACNIAEECKIPVILFDTPYNRLSSPSNVYRVKTWNEAKQIVQHLFHNEKSPCL